MTLNAQVIKTEAVEVAWQYISEWLCDTSILHHAFISIFIALWAVITRYVTIVMPFLSYFIRFT